MKINNNIVQFKHANMIKNYRKIKTHCQYALALILMGGTAFTATAQNSKVAAKQNSLQPKQNSYVQNDEFSRGGLFDGFKPTQELVEKRTQNSKHFQNADGSVTAQIGRIIHYKDAVGKWQDINLDIVQGTIDIAGYKFRNETNEVKSYFPSNPSQNGVLMKLSTDVSFSWWKNPSLSFTQNGQTLQSFSPQSSEGVVEGNKLTYPNVYAGISEEFEVLPQGLENNTIIHSLSPAMAALSGSAMLEFSQFVPLQNDWKVLAGNSVKTSNFEADNIFIRIPGMENGINFGSIVVFDNNISKEDAMLIHAPAEKLSALQKSKLQQSVHSIPYKVSFVNGGIKITAQLPASWLQASGRAFPVVIDPTVTITPTSPSGNFYGPMSHWYGYQRHADLYLQSELGSYGSITQIEYNSTTTGTAGSRPTKIYMRTTPATTLAGGAAWNSATYTNGATLCLDANTDQGNTTGWKALTLTAPFTYDQDNLLIMVGDYWGGSGAVKYYNMSSSVTSRQTYNRVDNTDPGDGATLATENYLPEIRITYNPLTNCSGLPAIGAATSTSASVCAGASFTLNLNSAPSAGGISFQWQSSTNGGTTWTNLGAAQSTAPYIVNSQSQATSYRVLVTCVPTSTTDSSAAVNVSMAAVSACYCTASTSNCGLDDEIQNVTFAGINQNSGCTSGYGNYLAVNGAVITGLSYPISITTGPGGNEAVAAWIDFDQNGVFDLSEYTYIGNTSGGTVSANITIPTGALTGSTRMRVRSFYVASGDPLTVYQTTPNSSCASISTGYGETEDYTIVITAGTNCSGTPDAGAATASITSACAGTPFILNSNGNVEVGINYQWQSSSDGIVWNNLGTSQSSVSYSVTSQTAATHYRVIFTCSNGNLSDTSSAVTVNQNTIAACLCTPVLDCTDNDMITNVTFGSINNNSSCGTNGYTNYAGSVLPASVNTSQTYPISVTVSDGWAYESVSVWVDYNHNGVFEANEFTFIATGSDETLTGNIAIPPTALAGNATMRVRVSAVDDVDATDDMACDEEQEYGETEDYLVNIITPSLIDSVVVTTQGNVPATIASPTGTLQLVATVYPITQSQAVTWTVLNGTGSASISAGGLVTAQSAGTVWAKATSVADITKSDSILVTIAPAVDSVVVTTQGNVPAVIATPTGTLQLVATVYPTSLSQAVTWSVLNGTGSATISASGLVTAQTAGNIWAKAVSTVDVTKSDSILITINPAVIPVDSVVVTTQGAVPANITTPSGTLPLVATVYPGSVAQTVTWSIIPVTGGATISAAGIVTATANGTVWAKAVSTVDVTKSDSILVTITLQDMGIEDVFTAADFNVFPNPTSDVVTLNSSKAHAALQLQVLDVTGKVILSRNIQSNELNGGIRLDLSAFSSGTYFIKFQGKEVNVRKTVIKK